MKTKLAKLFSTVPKAVGVLAVACGLFALGEPRAGACAFACWATGVLACWAAGVCTPRLVALSTHANLLAVGAMLGLSAQSSPAYLIAQLAAATVATLVLCALVARVFYRFWVPVLITPALLAFFAVNDLSLHVGTPNGDILWSAAGLLALSAALSPLFAAAFIAGTALASLGHEATGVAFGADSLISGAGFAFCTTILLMPSPRSILAGALGLLLARVIAPSMPVLGANISFTLVIYGAKIFSRPGSYWSWRLRPEKKLEEATSQWTRFRTGEARTGLPFAGAWTVSQGFAGELTHRGAWQHGLDFVVTDEGGRMFRGQGIEATDYLAFGQEVLAPSNGYVVARCIDRPDNPIGAVDNLHKFGNYVVIRDAYGAHVVVAHLLQGSVVPDLYQYVRVGELIGRCGNSGYSPVPHIHLHIQADAVIGSPTIPFHLTNYLCGETFHFHAVPRRDERIRRPLVNEPLARRLNFSVSETFRIVRKDGTATAIESCLDVQTGAMYLTDGKAKLYHHRDDLSFYFYHYEGASSGPLFDLMTALPRVPLIYGADCDFADVPPRGRSLRKFRLRSATLEVEGASSTCYLDPLDGLAAFNVEKRTYEISRRHEPAVPQRHFHDAARVG